uniref:Uncharacterized protein n=1 Tax=Anopheles melas TaxID=34690 RepID=A0A182TG43_9DIPT
MLLLHALQAAAELNVNTWVVSVSGVPSPHYFRYRWSSCLASIEVLAPFWPLLLLPLAAPPPPPPPPLPSMDEEGMGLIPPAPAPPPSTAAADCRRLLRSTALADICCELRTTVR